MVHLNMIKDMKKAKIPTEVRDLTPPTTDEEGEHVRPRTLRRKGIRRVVPPYPKIRTSKGLVVDLRVVGQIQPDVVPTDFLRWGMDGPHVVFMYYQEPEENYIDHRNFVDRLPYPVNPPVPPKKWKLIDTMDQ